MGQRIKNIGLSLLVLVVISPFFISPVRVLSFSFDPVSFLHKTTNTIISRVSDLIYYMILQKAYIFNDYVDPNSYPPLNIPAGLDKLPLSGSTTTLSNLAEGSLITVGTATLPVAKKTTSTPTKIVQTKTAFPEPVLVVKSDAISQPVIEEIINYNNGSDSQILTYTNIERIGDSLGPLVSNSKLDEIAALRADDLFDNQYFEHESPDGKSATDLASNVGYDYILIGENLALGNFSSDQAIVSAWMNSPGHRANILNDRYKELGVSIKSGIYKGENTTIAVQIFGLPLGNCPKPSTNSKSLIDSATISIKQMQGEALIMYNNLNTIKNSPGLDSGYYNQKISEYNYFAKKVNDAVISLKALVESYNFDVAKYNSCISSQ